jgi:MoxR-like ATPase
MPLSGTILAWVRRNVARRDRQLRQQQQLATSTTNEAGVEALLGSTFRAEESMDATHMKETFIAGSQSTAASPATLAIYTRPSDIIAFWSHCAKVLTSMLKQVAANPSDPTNVASRVEEALRVGGHADCPSLLSALLQVRRDLRTALLKAVEIFKSLYPLSPFTAAVDGGQTAAPLPPLKSAAMGLPALFHLYATAWKRCLHLTSQDLLALLTASIDTVIRLTECHIAGPNASTVWANEHADSPTASFAAVSQRCRESVVVLQELRVSYDAARDIASLECPSRPWNFVGLFVKAEASLRRYETLADVFTSLAEADSIDNTMIFNGDHAMSSRLHNALSAARDALCASAASLQSIPIDALIDPCLGGEAGNIEAFDVAMRTFQKGEHAFTAALDAIVRQSLTACGRNFRSVIITASIWSTHPGTGHRPGVVDAVAGALRKAFADMGAAVDHLTMEFDAVQQALAVPMQDMNGSARRQSFQPYLTRTASIATHVQWVRSLGNELTVILQQARLPGRKYAALPESTALTVKCKRLYARLADHEESVESAWADLINTAAIELFEQPVLRYVERTVDLELTQQQFGQQQQQLQTLGSAAQLSAALSAADLDSRLLVVSLDSTLLRILNEAVHMERLGIHVPGSASSIISQLTNTLLRVHAELDEACVILNQSVNNSTTLERSLLARVIGGLEHLILDGTTKVLWRGSDVESFAVKFVADVRRLAGVTRYVRGNLATIEKIVSGWRYLPSSWVFTEPKTFYRTHGVIESIGAGLMSLRPSRGANADSAAAPEDAEEAEQLAQDARVSRREELARRAVRKWRALVSLHVASIGDVLVQHRRIHRLVLNTRGAVNITESSPEWIAFKQHIDTVVGGGLTVAIEQCLRHVVRHLDIRPVPQVHNPLAGADAAVSGGSSGAVVPASLHSSQSPSVITVTLTLSSPVISSMASSTAERPVMDDTTPLASGPLRRSVFEPDIAVVLDRMSPSVQDKVFKWITNALSVADSMRMFGDTDKTFYVAVANDPRLLELQDDALKLTDLALRRLRSLQTLFDEHRFLWELSPSSAVHSFCKGYELADTVDGWTPLTTSSVATPTSQQRKASTKAGRSLPETDMDHHDDFGLQGPMFSNGWSLEAVFVDGAPQRRKKLEREAQAKQARHVRKPSLIDIETRIARFENLPSTIQRLPSYVNYGWLRIDCSPLRNAAVTLASSWKNAVGDYLLGRVQRKLARLDAYCSECERHIIQAPMSTDEQLGAVVKRLQELQVRAEKFDHYFEPVKDTLAVLKRHDFSVPPNTDRTLESVVHRWREIRRQCSQVGDGLAMRQHTLVGSLRAREADFTRKFEIFMAKLAERDRLPLSIIGGSIGPLLRLSTFAASQNLSASLTITSAATATADGTAVAAHLAKAVRQFRGIASSGVAHAAFSKLRLVTAEVELRENTLKQLRAHQDVFGMPPAPCKPLLACKAMLVTLKRVWDIVGTLERHLVGWCATSFSKLSIEHLEEALKSILFALRALDRQSRQFLVTTELEAAVHTLLSAIPLATNLRHPSVKPKHIRQLLEHIGQNTLVLAESSPFNRLDSITLVDILTSGMTHHADAVAFAVEKAVRESQVERQLDTMRSVWLARQMTFVPSGVTREGKAVVTDADTEVYLVVFDDDQFAVVEEHQVVLQQLGATRHADEFAEELAGYRRGLSDLEAVAILFRDVQATWKALVNVFFDSEDVQAQLTEYVVKFRAVHSDLVTLLARLHLNEEKLSILQWVDNVHGVRDMLSAIQDRMAECQRALDLFLDVKRRQFPRLNFLSLPDVLELLAIHDIASLSNLSHHIGKLFPGIERVHIAPPPPQPTTASGLFAPFVSPSRRRSSVLPMMHAAPGGETLSEVPFGCIVGVSGIGGEELTLTMPVLCQGRVENWLRQLTNAIRTTVAHHVVTALDAHSVAEDRGAWVLDTLSQVALLAERIQWTSAVVAGFHRLEDGDHRGLSDVLAKVDGTLQQLVKRVQTNLSPSNQTKLMNVVTCSVHCRDILSELVTRKAESEASFLWRQQLRAKALRSDTAPSESNPAQETSSRTRESAQTRSHNLTPRARGANAATAAVADGLNIAVSIEICDVSLAYGWEYVGNPLRLVVTPLTNRINVTLALALHLKLGGAPAGPAGTGKTESTKDLGAHVGKPVFVYNCSDQMTSASLGVTLRGVAASGAWGCFDEFNRISVDVLSVFSSQFKSLLDALRDTHRRSFVFMGETCELHHSCGVFITMNPGYAGRTELPDSLKVLFRQVTVVVPDLQLIAENLLLAAGFTQARGLSRKIMTLFRLGQELLSKAAHYDWGLRSVKALLLVASTLRRADVMQSEEQIVLGALRDFHLPKLAAADVDVLQALLADLFPHVTQPPSGDSRLYEAARSIAPTLKLHPEPGLLTRAVQLHGVMAIRHSLFIVGPPSCGKTATWRTLLGALRILGCRVTVRDLNPKVVSAAHLYGFTNSVSKEWKDGLLTTCLRELCAIPAQQQRQQTLAAMESLMNQEPSMGTAAEHTAVVRNSGSDIATAGNTARVAPPKPSANRAPRRASMVAIQPPTINPAVLKEAQRALTNSSTMSPNASTAASAVMASSSRVDALPSQYQWLLLDGDLDTNWIESLNSVMDDNKVLTLANHERITLPSSVRLVFELDSLRHATPATVSRAGILHISSTDIGWLPIVHSRYEGRPNQAAVLPLFDRVIPSVSAFVQAELATTVPFHTVQAVIQLCVVLDAVLAGSSDLSEKDVEGLFTFALVWSFGALLPGSSGAESATSSSASHTDSRQRFDKWLRRERRTVKIPSEGSVYDYIYDIEEHAFVPWLSKLRACQDSQRLSSTGNAVDAHKAVFRFAGPAAATAGISATIANAINIHPWLAVAATAPVEAFLPSQLGALFTVSAALSSNTPVVIVGAAGSGKTTLLQRSLLSLPIHDAGTLRLQFSHAMTAETFQTLVESHLDRRGGRGLAPKRHAVLVIGIEDVHLPAADIYGSQPPLALLQQLLDYGHWSESSKWNFRDITGIQFVATLAATAGDGNANVSSRLLAKCVSVTATAPSRDGLLRSVVSWLSGGPHAEAPSPSATMQACAQILVEAAEAMQRMFPATAATPQYNFTWSHIVDVAQALYRAYFTAESGFGSAPHSPTGSRGGAAGVRNASAAAVGLLTAHEFMRGFGDGLRSTSELNQFSSMLSGLSPTISLRPA